MFHGRKRAGYDLGLPRSLPVGTKDAWECRSARSAERQSKLDQTGETNCFCICLPFFIETHTERDIYNIIIYILIIVYLY